MIHSPFELGDFDFLWGSQANPAAGANLTITSPANCRSELLSLSVFFSADANVADRFFTLSATKGVTSVILGMSEFPLTANQARSILLSNAGFSSVADGGQGIVIGIPSYPVFLEGVAIILSVSGIQAADQISTVHYVFKTWVYQQ